MDNRYGTLKDSRKKYKPSTTELILEQICQSFGTELLPAEINDMNGVKLVRKSKPSLVNNDGKSMVMQFQYTRFSPLVDYNKLVEIFNKNRTLQKGKRKLSYESVWREIRNQHEKWDAFEEVTNERYIKNLNLMRWRKGLYFAVYDVEDVRGIEEKLNPFLIHEKVQFNGKLPQIHITLCIEPFFIINYVRESTKEIYDDLFIDFPQAEAKHKGCIDSALSLHPLNNLINPENAFKEHYERLTKKLQIHSDVRREQTMGLITAYLRHYVLNKGFY